METTVTILAENLNALKLFNLFSEERGLTFLQSKYNEFIKYKESINSLRTILNKEELNLFNSQIGKKTSSISLFVFGIDELTVLKIYEKFTTLEDILTDIDSFFDENLLTMSNRISLLNGLLNYYSNHELLTPFILNVIIDKINDGQPIHKNILLSKISNSINSFDRLTSFKYLNHLIKTDRVHSTVNGLVISSKNTHSTKIDQSNVSKITDIIGSYFKDFEKLILQIKQSELNIPKNYYFIKRFIKNMGIKVENNIVLNLNYQNLNNAVYSWLMDMPGVIDESNIDNLFHKNKYFKKLIDQKIFIPYKKNKFLNTSKFLKIRELEQLWNDIFDNIPNETILTTKSLSEMDFYRKILEKHDKIESFTFNEYFLSGLVIIDKRLFKIRQNNHVFNKSNKIKKIDIIKKIVLENDRISIQRIKHRLMRDYEINNFDYGLISKSIKEFKFYKDSNYYIYKSYQSYIEFMRRGKWI